MQDLRHEMEHSKGTGYQKWVCMPTLRIRKEEQKWI